MQENKMNGQQNTGLEIVGAKRYGPVGECIYCGYRGKTDADLTDEHIIPYALNGNWILRKSSCRECARITGTEVEQVVLRGELRHVRAAVNFQTRRRVERPQQVKLLVDGHNVEFPIADCPIILPFIKFPPPGLVDGRPSKRGINAVGSVTIKWGPDPNDFVRRHGIKEVSFSTNVAPAMFARMIAKIGYSFAVARFGKKSILREVAAPVILGQSDRIGDIVGCAVENLPPLPHGPNEHVLQPALYKGGASGGDQLLAIRVKLFADSPSPVYEVIVGRPAEPLTDEAMSADHPHD